MKLKLCTSNPLVGSFKTGYVVVQVFLPTNSYTMPDMAVFGKYVFRMFKHIRSRNAESVLRKIFGGKILVTVGKPYLLEEDDLWLLASHKFRKIKLISLKPLQVETEY